MHGNIDSPLGLKHSDKTVDARGWLQFEDDEMEATLTVKFTQNGVSGTRSVVIERNGDDPMTWQLDVTAAYGAKFQKAVAHGRADADVTAPGTVDAGWDKDVKLN